MTGALKALVLVACGYEAGALASRGHAPTISVLCGRHRWLRPLIVGGLIVHLYHRTKEVV